MSRIEELEAFRKDELIALAEEFELDATGTKSALAERIVSFETGAPAKYDEPGEVVAPKPEPEPEPEPENAGGVRLVRFIGKNPLYQVKGFVFTPKNPFQAVSRVDADYLVSIQNDKFRFATDAEVQDFYS